MIDLPAALAPWSRELSIFPRELALDLGAMVRRVASLIGNAAPARRGAGDPDGFEGLARRGPYDRLLHSEWLLAEELPEEFARRAAMHEHLFFELARQHPVQHPLAVALFDAGPSQLGAPRLAHIAALIVLARRAVAAEATFRFGVLQRPEAGLLDGVSEASVVRLLEARGAGETSDAHIDAWQKALFDDAETPVGELWFVGPARLSRFPLVRKQWLLETEDVLRVDAWHVTATVRHQTRAEPPVVLPLPQPRQCSRILRGEFRPQQRTMAPRSREVPESQSSVQIVSNVLFGPNQRTILGRSRDGHLIVQRFDSASRGEPPTIYPVGEGETLVAAGWGRRRGAMAVTVRENGVYVRSSSRKKSDAFPFTTAISGVAFDVSADAPLHDALLIGPRYRGLTHGVMFLDAEGQLFLCIDSGGAHSMAKHVAAIHGGNGRLTVLRRTDANEWVHAGAKGWRQDDILDTIPRAGARAFFGYSPMQGVPTIAYELVDDTWIVERSGEKHVIEPPAGARVVGVTGAGLGVTRAGVSLVITQQYDRLLMLVSPQRHSRAGELIEIPDWGRRAAIRHVTVDAYAPLVGLVMEDGEVAVLSLRNGSVLFRSRPEEPS